MNKNAVILHCLNPRIQSAGGMATYAFALAKIANDNYLLNDFDIIIEKISTHQNIFYDRIKNLGKNTIKKILPEFTVKAASSMIYYFTGNKATEAILKKKSIYDTTILHELSNFNLHSKIKLFLKIPNLKIVSTFLDLQDFYYPDNYSSAALKKRRDVYDFLKNNASQFIAISDYTKKTMTDCLDIPIDKITAIHLAHDAVEALLDLEFETKLKQFGKYFVYPAKAWPHKNHEFLLRTVARLKREFNDKNYKLILCGGFQEKDKNYLKTLISDFKIENNVIVLDFLENNQLKLLVSNAQFMVFPSLFEGFGIPVIEAMYLKCPVLSSNATSLPEVCGKAALFFDAKSKDSLEQIFIEAINDKIDRNDLIARGIENIKRFSWEKCVSNTVDIYNKVFKACSSIHYPS